MGRNMSLIIKSEVPPVQAAPRNLQTINLDINTYKDPKAIDLGRNSGVPKSDMSITEKQDTIKTAFLENNQRQQASPIDEESSALKLYENQDVLPALSLHKIQETLQDTIPEERHV